MDNKIDTISEKWADPTFSIKPSSPLPVNEQVLQDKTKSTLTNIILRPTQQRRKQIPTKLMVDAAIKSQMTTKRSGVSLVAIKKYIAQNYEAANIDINNRMKHIKRYIMSALENGKLVRTKGGVGVSGSFRLPLSESKLHKTIQKTKNKKKRAKKLKTLKSLRYFRGASGSGGGKHLVNSALVNLKRGGGGTKSRGSVLARKK